MVRTPRFDYNPCPSCYAWVSDLAKHRSYSDRCIMKESTGDKMGKREVQLRAEVQRGLHKTASKMLQEEVLSKLKDDDVSNVIKGDELLIEFGNFSLRKNIRNKLRRGSYASNKMRLCARVLIECRRIDSSTSQWSAFLIPEKFKTVVQAVTTLCGGTDDSLETPSNALKMGQHIKELTDIKETNASIKRDTSSVEDCRQFRLLVEKNWRVEVSALACAILSERKFNKTIQLPGSDDLRKLSEYLKSQATKIQEITNADAYRHAVQVAEARLLTYNKRRPGELEAIRYIVTNYSELFINPPGAYIRYIKRGSFWQTRDKLLF